MDRDSPMLSVDLLQVDEVLDDLVGDGEEDHPVHEVEGEEGDGEHNAAVLVNVAGLHPRQQNRMSLSQR